MREKVKYIADRIGFEKMAKELHVHFSTVYYWASGDRKPSYHAGIAIEKLYKKTRNKFDKIKVPVKI